ncbi:HEAT repeat domain-containing protein [Aquimarina brevivitae]|uniref:HEAT repeat protein n=1 Tax=Aquimarina brevivitae TaxID=323412 RepID=A0A4Q7PHP6_9FLAO|nr:hypothetical protein [Aquimarina brevivitae]RZS99468.1 hypothetical protein EV197_0685 [Aquimarina brevivitae]
MKNTIKTLVALCALAMVLSIVQSCENDVPENSEETNAIEVTTKATEYSSELSFDESSVLSLDGFFASVPNGKLIQEHLQLAVGSGKDAEERYLWSLHRLRDQKNLAESIAMLYQKIPDQNYLYRTMLIETLKELRTEEALEFLYEIASLNIPRDTAPENPEIDTRLDEIIIRITAVEGLGILAKNKNEVAEKMLFRLTTHEDLTVRQMATRNYLQSPLGNVEEKMEMLYERLPKNEHWYITTKATDIRKVEHPDMPEEFEIKLNETKETPKIR